MLLAQSHGVNIKSANNLQQYVAATFGSQVNERLVVLDLATTAIVEQRARGLNGYKKVDALRAELADRQLDTTGKKADLVARLDAAAAEVPLGWKDLEQILQDLQDKKWTDLYNKIRSDVGVESFAVGLADNGVAMREALAYVRQNFAKEDAAAYLSVLLYLDLQTSDHPLISRCAPEWLEQFLENPESDVFVGGFSLATGPQAGLALFHSLKYIGRLFIYKTIMWNKIPGLRLPGEIVTAVDKAVLRVYGGETRSSHLNYVYGPPLSHATDRPSHVLTYLADIFRPSRFLGLQRRGVVVCGVPVAHAHPRPPDRMAAHSLRALETPQLWRPPRYFSQRRGMQ
jgi:hypothetical protein